MNTPKSPSVKDRPVQHFSEEYLERCREMSPTQIAEFVESFRLMCHQSLNGAPQKLISIRVPTDLLVAFRERCTAEGKLYQSQTKRADAAMAD